LGSSVSGIQLRSSVSGAALCLGSSVSGIQLRSSVSGAALCLGSSVSEAADSTVFN